MALVSTVNEEELKQIAKDTYVNESFDVVLINAPGSTFTPSDTYSTVVAGEITSGVGGYTRKTFTYASTDIGVYQTGLKAVPLARKAVTFNHDDSQDVMEWTHVALIRRSTSGVVSVTELSSSVQMVEDQQAIYYFDLFFYGTTGTGE